VPVICIGNFTAGGTGKTPLALTLAQLLVERGERPAFLTRGYKGRVRQPHLVDLSLDTAADVGDEAMMLAAAAPTVVAANRPIGARALLALAAPPTVIVMDDGLQNPGLAKSLTIAVVDGSRGLGNGRVMPAGPLRAPLAAQLARTDAIVVNVAALASGVGGAADTGVLSRFRAEFPGPVLAAAAEATGDTDWLAGRTWVAFAGIGNPQRFFDTLAGVGADVVHRVPFSDHHAFSETDANELLDTAHSVGAGLVTTEKDRMRLVGQAGKRGQLADEARVLAIRLVLGPADMGRLGARVDGALPRFRGRS
jgi:tetraacyldisaccharide 4'-kinase